MKIEKIDQNKLKITLSPTDMLQINLELDEQEPQNLLEQLFYTLEKEYHFSVLNEKILLETVPSVQEGYYLFITKSNIKAEEKSEVSGVSILTCSDWKIAEYIFHLLNGNITKRCAIYRMDGEYYFVLYSKSDTARKKTKLLLSDLGEWMDNPELYEGVLQEYGVFLTYLENFSEFLKKSVK